MDVLISALTPSILAIGLYITIRHFKYVREISYIERFNTTRFMAVRTKVANWLNSDLKEEEKLKLLDSDMDLRHNFLLLYNLLTEVGIAYKFGLIDKEITLKKSSGNSNYSLHASIRELPSVVNRNLKNIYLRTLNQNYL